MPQAPQVLPAPALFRTRHQRMSLGQLDLVRWDLVQLGQVRLVSIHPVILLCQRMLLLVWWDQVRLGQGWDQVLSLDQVE